MKIEPVLEKRQFTAKSFRELQKSCITKYTVSDLKPVIPCSCAFQLYIIFYRMQTQCLYSVILNDSVSLYCICIAHDISLKLLEWNITLNSVCEISLLKWKLSHSFWTLFKVKFHFKEFKEQKNLRNNQYNDNKLSLQITEYRHRSRNETKRNVSVT